MGVVTSTSRHGQNWRPTHRRRFGVGRSGSVPAVGEGVECRADLSSPVDSQLARSRREDRLRDGSEVVEGRAAVVVDALFRADEDARRDVSHSAGLATNPSRSSMTSWSHRCRSSSSSTSSTMSSVGHRLIRDRELGHPPLRGRRRPRDHPRCHSPRLDRLLHAVNRPPLGTATMAEADLTRSR